MPLEIKQVTDLEDALTVEFTCTATEQVNDLVYISAADTVAQADASDTAKIDVIGWIKSKPDATTCRVAFGLGPVTSSGLTAGSRVWLSASTPGAATTTAPSSSNSRVEVGIAKSATSFVFTGANVVSTP